MENPYLNLKICYGTINSSENSFILWLIHNTHLKASYGSLYLACNDRKAFFTCSDQVGQNFSNRAIGIISFEKPFLLTDIPVGEVLPLNIYFER